MRRPFFRTIARHGVSWLANVDFERLPWLRHGFSLRPGGSNDGPAAGLNLGFSESALPERVEENRRQFLRALGVASFRLAELEQIHSAASHQVTRLASQAQESFPCQADGLRQPEGQTPQGDILLTDQPGILLAVRSADCLPVLLADLARRAVAAVHAGWRGALSEVVEKAVSEMSRAFESSPRSLVAALGPSIRPCCYEVGPEIEEEYSRRFPQGRDYFHKPLSAESSERARRATLDLVAVARHQLRRAGVPAANIFVADFCTACRTDLFFSHRKEGNRTGRMMAVIGMRPL